jgi:hypothetical protein
VEQVTITTTRVEESVDVSAAPAYRLIVPAPASGPISRLFVVQARVKNVSQVALQVRPEGARLLLPDGSGGTVFDRPRATELLRRTLLASLDAPSANRAGALREPVQARLMVEVLTNLLDGTELAPGQEVQGYIVTDTGTSVASLAGIVLEVSATRASDQSVVRGSYEFATPAVATDAREN